MATSLITTRLSVFLKLNNSAKITIATVASTISIPFLVHIGDPVP